jgi:hypothetical protein
MEHWRNETDRGKEENIYSSVSLSTTNAAQADLGSNPNLCASTFVLTYTSFYSQPEYSTFVLKYSIHNKHL